MWCLYMQMFDGVHMSVVPDHICSCIVLTLVLSINDVQTIEQGCQTRGPGATWGPYIDM